MIHLIQQLSGQTLRIPVRQAGDIDFHQVADVCEDRLSPHETPKDWGSLGMLCTSISLSRNGIGLYHAYPVA
jgi:hypothetical protein